MRGHRWQGMQLSNDGVVIGAAFLKDASGGARKTVIENVIEASGRPEAACRA